MDACYSTDGSAELASSDDEPEDHPGPPRGPPRPRQVGPPHGPESSEAARANAAATVLSSRAHRPTSRQSTRGRRCLPATTTARGPMLGLFLCCVPGLLLALAAGLSFQGPSTPFRGLVFVLLGPALRHHGALWLTICLYCSVAEIEAVQICAQGKTCSLTALPTHGASRSDEADFAMLGSRSRPIPTPCRAMPRYLPEPDSPAEDPILCTPGLRTLLEDSIAQPTSQAMFLAATLLDTLFSHFTVSFPEPEQVKVTATEDVPATLSLQQHLPTARQFDLTGVQLQIGCTLDHVAALLHPCAYPLWEILPAHLCIAGKEFADAHCKGPNDVPIDAITVFTDGSFDGNCSSWAFHAIGSNGQHSSSLGWIGGLVSIDPTDPNFAGATAHGALQGELTALFWCLTWLLRAPDGAYITIFSDCTSAIGLSDGRCGNHNGQGLPGACRAVMQALGAIIPMQRFSIQHVKSHVGHAGNELADGLAKHCNSPAFDRAFWPVNPFAPRLAPLALAVLRGPP